MSSVLIGGEDQREVLLAALEMGMVSNGYVFIPYDALLYAMPYQVTTNKFSRRFYSIFSDPQKKKTESSKLFLFTTHTPPHCLYMLIMTCLTKG